MHPSGAIRPRREALRAYRLVLLLAGLTLGLLVLVGVLLIRIFDRTSLGSAALQIPSVRQQVIAHLVAENKGYFDSHVDSDVGYVNLPGMEDRLHQGSRITTNRFGIRERDYALPKPPGVVRVVLLGDSMVYGQGVEAEHRLGARLEAWLEERVSGFDGQIECLHLGVPSWNLQAQCSYLRRQLSLLQPDLVVQVSVPNDIEDGRGVRGFGSGSRFSPQKRSRADSRISAGFPVQVLGFRRHGLVRAGLDYESRQRYAEALGYVRRLEEAVEQAGGYYRLILHFRELRQAGLQGLGRHLSSREVVYLNEGFAQDPAFQIARGDPHWNRRGHEEMARLIYGLIVRDDLLPALGLEAWPEATETLERIAATGSSEAAGQVDNSLPRTLRRSIRGDLSLARLNAATASQIHGGIDPKGQVSPYASVILKNERGQSLHLRGHALPRPELDGTRVDVFVDEVNVGELEIRAGTKLTLDVPLPPKVRDRPYLSVRLSASDYVYDGPSLQHCVVFKLERIWIES